jgi:NAD(P)H-hydrate epimerase
MKLSFFCGTGNNGGDGYFMGAFLSEQGYTVRIVDCQIGKRSKDNALARKYYERKSNYEIITLSRGDDFLEIAPDVIIIDAIFGSGLNRPVEGYWGDLLKELSKEATIKIAIDCPSGLFAEKPSTGVIFKADYTLVIESPRLSFMLPEYAANIGIWIIVPIDISEYFKIEVESNDYYLERLDIFQRLKIRKKFDHKGVFGHSLLVMGAYGKVGAAILSAKACLRSGTGLVTIHAPKIAYPILQIGLPEAMVSVDEHEYVFSTPPLLDSYKAIGVGCGIGIKEMTVKGLSELIKTAKVPMVIDADGLNILAENKELLQELPNGTILTPHPKEFERLFGKMANSYQRLSIQREKAKEYNITIVYKGAYTTICTPEGNCYFNSTGNPGMATAGSGDVLTGILTGLLAQGYSSEEACIIGVYIHGLAGDLAAIEKDQEALLASDIIEYIGRAYGNIRSILKEQIESLLDFDIDDDDIYEDDPFGDFN